MGNMNGRTGKSACGSMGYAIVDAQYADYVIAITDNLVPFPNLPASIDQTLVDTVVVVDSIGDPKKIVSGAIRDSDNPRDLLIAKNAVDVIVNSGYFKRWLCLSNRYRWSKFISYKTFKRRNDKTKHKSFFRTRRNNFSIS